MKLVGKISPRARSRPLVPTIPLQKVCSPRPRSPPSSKKSPSAHAKTFMRVGLGTPSVDDGNAEIKISPRFGLEPPSPDPLSTEASAQRPASASERQLQAVAAHIARQRDNRPDVAARKNPLLGKPGTKDKTAKPTTASPINHFSKHSKPIHLSLDSANFSSIFEDTATLSDIGSDFDACSLAESTSGKITILCNRADVLMRELVDIVGPLTPPITPTAVTPQFSQPRENTLEIENSPSHSINDASGHGTQVACTKGGEDISDLQFRISRLELQVSQITNPKQVSGTDDIAELKRWVEITQAELQATREEAFETKVQLDVLTKRASMLEIRSSSYPGFGHVVGSDNSDFIETGGGVHRFSSVSSDGSQHLFGVPLANTNTSDRPPEPLPRARSFDSVSRKRFYPLTPGAVGGPRSYRGPQRAGSKDPLASRRRSFPSPRVADMRMCTAEQLLQAAQNRAVRMHKTADSAVCSRNGKTTKALQAQLCARTAKNTILA